MTPAVTVSALVSHLLTEIERDPSVEVFSRLSSAKEIWRSLLFCILSSQVRVETAARAAQCLAHEIPFFETNLSREEVYGRTTTILRRPDVRHRFPNIRARQIADSWFSFAQVREEFYEFLDSHRDECDARLSVVSCFSGLGFKQASMFLRDIGYSNRLCVIDTHILWYCASKDKLPGGSLTPAKYVKLENNLLEESQALRVEPNIFDAAIWVAVSTVKAQRCTTQYV
jgi:N-glycosylase/DNA lyase